MKKIRLIMCLTMALTILMGSVLSVSASEINENEVEENVVANVGEHYFDGYEYDENGNIVIRAYGYFPPESISSNAKDGYSVYGSEKILDCVNGVSEVFIKKARPVIYKEWYSDTQYYYAWHLAYVENGVYNYKQINMRGTIVSESEEINGKYGNYFPSNSILGQVLNANIPMFETYEDALKYLENNDDSGIVNKPPFPEEDETFAFVDFQINEYISATWSGTTFDDRVNEFDNMGFEVAAVYAFDNSLQIATNEVILDDGNLLAHSWSKKQLLLQHEDESLYLRAVVFTPYCEKYGQRCVGKSETIWLTSDGNIDYIPNGELTMIEDSGFYLKGVSVEESFLGVVDGDVRSYISWTGTTRDNMIAKVPLDKTYADILCLCYTPTYKTTFVDLYELDTNFMGGKPLSLRRSLNDATQSFYIDYSVIDEHASAMGLIFSGKLYITPYFYYENDNAIYKGAVTIVNILHNELEQNPDDGGILVPDITVTPSPSPEVTPDLGGDGDIDNIDIGNIFNSVWNFLKSLWSGMGQFPSLMYSIFPYIPQEVYTYIGLALLFVIIFRFIGR